MCTPRAPLACAVLGTWYEDASGRALLEDACSQGEMLGCWELGRALQRNGTRDEYFRGDALMKAACRSGLDVCYLRSPAFQDAMVAYLEGRCAESVAAGCLAAGRFLVTWDWGANGCKTLTTHFAIDGSRVKDARGVSATRENCDDWGNPTRIEYLDENDRLTTATDVGARWEGTRDAQGRLVATAWYGVDGRPIVRAGRVFDRYQYDAAGRTIEATRHAADGTLVASEGAARIVFIYDDDGHLVERRYLGVDGKLARYRRAQAIERHRYDSRGNDVLSRAFGPDGLLTRSERGYASREVDYDAFDQPIDERTFGVDGKPVDSGRGYARRKLSYDPAGRAVTRELFDAEGNPVPRVSLRHVAVQFATSDPPTVARTKAEARARADEILARLGKGEPWASVVERFSDDRAAVAREGWLGDFGPSAKDWSELVEAAKGLKKGDVGGVVERWDSFHIVMLED